MRVISFILLTIFLMETSIAAITPKEELKLVLDELEFSLKVEWDQKDKVFAEKKMEEFNERLKVLYKKGLKKEDLLLTMEESITDEKFKKDLATLQVQMKFTNLSFEETRQILKENYQKTLQKGASWNGKAQEVLPMILIGAIIVGIIAFLTVSSIQCSKDPSCGSGPGSTSGSDDDDDWDSSDDWSDDDWDDDYDDSWCEDEYVCDYYDDGYSYCYTTTYCY